MEDRNRCIENAVDIHNKQQIMQNRKNIMPIIEAIFVLGRQEMPLRGHRDSGKIVTDTALGITNEGNFRALLKYRAKGDPDLKRHLDGAGERNKYISPSIQNEIINAFYVLLIGKVIKKVKKAKFFAILADETRDVATIEQVTICLRYVEEIDNKHVLREDFLKFVPTASTTGRALADIIVKTLQDVDIDLSNMIGQGYDGANNMSGRFNGVQSIIRENFAPHALYVHCAAHSLNLAISVTSKIPAIRDCLSTIEKVYDFFNTPKRKAALEEVITQSEETPRIQKLKRLNLTRWVAKYNAVSDFIEIYKYVYEALESLRESETDAKMLKLSMDFEFLISLFIINRLYQISLPLSAIFQKINIDLMLTVTLANDLSSELQKIRGSDECFLNIYKEAENMATMVDVEIKYKRTVGRQKHRANPDVQSIEQYFKVTIFNPFVDFYLMELQEK